MDSPIKKTVKIFIIAICIFIIAFFMILISIKISGGFGERFISTQQHSISWKETFKKLPTILEYTFGVWIAGLIILFYIMYYYPKKH